MTNEEFSRLVEQYEKLVFTVCYQMVRDYQEAQNLAQETFLSAYRHKESCPPENYKPWLVRIASNKATDCLRSAYQRRVVVGGDELLETFSARGSPEELAANHATEEAVRLKISELKEPYQKVSELYFLKEMSVDEICTLLKRPKKTVQTQLYRAKHILRQQLKEEREL